MAQHVTTYQSPSGAEIDVTRAQARRLARAGVWPKDGTGQEYCTISHGLHAGAPTFSQTEINNLIDPFASGMRGG